MYSELEGPDGSPDVVCLHGGIGTGRYHWSRQIPALDDAYRVHLPDLPGHGATPLEPGAPYSQPQLTDAVEKYVSELQGPIHVVGFSMGGHTALDLAARRPELFASLTLIGVAIRDHEGLDGWRERFAPDRLEEVFPMWVRVLSKLHAPLGGADAWRDVCRRDSSGDLGVRADLDALAKLSCPVMLVRGDRDPVAEPSQYAELRELWPDAEEFVVPGGGHDVQLTRFRLVRPGVRDFLDRAAASAS